jgi:predicted enzyme related to lactoylglutathione lyase
MPGINDLAWFQIGTDQPVVTETFFHDVFGWTFTDDDETTTTDDTAYRSVSVPDNAGPSGTLFATAGTMPNHAIFYLLVADTAETCRRAEAAGGKVVAAPRTNDAGLTFAQLLDPTGNQFGVFTPPPRG